MTDIVISLPDGRSVELDRAQAQLVADRLWAMGIRPGAALGATRLTEALRRPAPAAIVFEAREADALDHALDRG